MTHTQMLRQCVGAVVLTGMLAVSLTACGASNSGKSASDSSSAQAEKNGTINVLVHDSFNLPDELLADFEKESGYKVVTSSSGDAGVANSLRLAKGKGSYDAVYGLDNYNAYQVINEGIFDSYVSKTLPTQAQADVLANSLTPIDKGYVCVNIDHAWFKNNAMAEPTSLEQLAKPEYAKLLVVENAATSSPGFAYLVASIADRGEDGYLSYWTDLLKGGTRVDSGWSEAYYTDFSGSEGKGAYPLVVSYASSPVESEGATGVMESSCTRQVEYAGILKGAKNVEGAKAFVDFMLSEKVQKAIPSSMYMYPITNVELPEAWEKYAKAPETTLTVDPQTISAKRQEWIKDWNVLVEEYATK